MVLLNHDAMKSPTQVSNPSTPTSTIHPFLPTLNALLTRIVPHLAIHAALLIELGLDSQVALDDLIDEEVDEMGAMVVDELVQGLKGEMAGIPRLQAQKLVFQVEKE